MGRVRIQVTEHFKKHEADLEAAVRGALAVAGRQAAARSREVATNYNIHGIVDSIHPSRVYKTRRGFGVSVIADDWREIFFEKGTYSRRRAKLKQERRSTSGQRGVKAGHFLRKGLKGADEVIDASKRLMR